ncbi:MAG: response regulator [Armatimonadetes bacterium]|nr:response regulator [Armatimonadota bacterium]
MHILLAEDSPTLGQALERRLTRSGHSVKRCATAKEASDYFQADYRVDCLIVDNHMESADAGLGLVQEVLQPPIALKPHRIIVSSMSADRNRAALCELGVPNSQILQKTAYGESELWEVIGTVQDRVNREDFSRNLRDLGGTMRIHSLSLCNFRGFEQLELNFAPQFNVLIGDNATGKTAVLEALAIGAGSWFLGIRGAPARQIREADPRVAGRLVGDQFTYEKQWPVEITCTGEVGGEFVAWTRSLSDKKGRPPLGGAARVRELAARAEAAVLQGDAAEPLPVLAYYGAGRLWVPPAEGDLRPDLTQEELSRLYVYREGLESRVSPAKLTRWLAHQDYVAYQQRSESRLYRVVKEAMRRMLEGAEELRFDAGRAEVAVRLHDGRVLPFSHLSHGQRNMAALAGDLAMRMARLNPQLGEAVLGETAGLVLIDELDLHLHPGWQRRVVEDLRSLFPQVQFIATTHSPFIVQSLRDGELISLDAQPPLSLGNLGIEAIAAGVMGVERPETSPRYHTMVQTARSYLETLAEAAAGPPEALPGVRERLADQIAPFADNPAFQAFLELRRVAKLKE